MTPAPTRTTIEPRPRLIPLPQEGQGYARLLGGPPETSRLRSGCVELKPGESVGLHSTGADEEIVIPLSGSGELTCPGCDPLLLRPGAVYYNPPQTPHDVVNTGAEPLRYIYIVAMCEEKSGG